jgi:hypothetical protein
MCCSRALHPCEADKSYTVYRKPFPSRRASECDDQQALHMLHSQAITISKLFPHITLSNHYHFQIIPLSISFGVIVPSRSIIWRAII